MIIPTPKGGFSPFYLNSEVEALFMGLEENGEEGKGERERELEAGGTLLR